MKPTVAADEMFPEGVGPYMDLEEVSTNETLLSHCKGSPLSTFSYT